MSTRVGIKCRRCAGVSATTSLLPRSRGWALPAIAALVGVVLLGGAGVGLVAVVTGGHAPRMPVPTASHDGERHLYLTSGDGTSLSATLRIPPHAAGTRIPGVLIVPDPWAADRDGRVVEAGLNNSPYRVIAEELAQRGIASLRYDQRGVGDSALAPDHPVGGFGELQSDALAAYATLRAQAGIDRNRVAIVGHGAGGLLAMSLASGPRPPAALVLVDTPGRPLLQDLRSGFIDHALPGFGAQGSTVLAAFDAAAAEISATGVATHVDPAVAPYLPPAHAELLRDLFRIDPAALAATVKGRVLVFSGRLDPEIPVADGRLLAAALSVPSDTATGAVTGHNLEVRPDVASDPSHAAVMARTVVPDTDTDATGAIVSWLQEHTRP